MRAQARGYGPVTELGPGLIPAAGDVPMDIPAAVVIDPRAPVGRQ